jgi:hypothetical protein
MCNRKVGSVVILKNIKESKALVLRRMGSSSRQ